MAGTSSYPTGFDSFPEVASQLDGTGGTWTHEQDHENKGKAVENIEAELGLSPSGPHSTVADAIDAIEGDMIQHLAYTPAGNEDASTGAGIWITLGNVTVPTWATSYLIITSISGPAAITAAVSYELKSRVGFTVIGTVSGRALVHWAAVGGRQAAAWVSKGATVGSGSQAVIIHADRTAGTGQARADASCAFTATVIFRA